MSSLFAEDRVLVGVIARKRDVRLLLDQRVYRIPVAAMPDGVQADVLGFFLSRSAAGRPGIYYYAMLRGIEMVRRRDVLPQEATHTRADDRYWLCQVGTVRETHPPILNVSQQAFAFIRTTWDRFADALTVADLYTPSRYYVSRVYYALSRPSEAPSQNKQ